MSSTELLTIDPANALVLKAFLKALAKLEPFPQALQPELKKVASALAKGETKLAAQLAEIAKKDDSLNQLFQDERSRMVRLCESEGEKPGKPTGKVTLAPQPHYDKNVAAEPYHLGYLAAAILGSDNPSKSAKDSSDEIDKAPPLLDLTTIITP